ncbi:hypothetical protein [Streptomyces sp. NPDC085596]|uniref:hypothetical protein n=1 Tax=Streptomyces sp. NPDC085596 TaxID=3365731 RepID=UPI0037D3F4BE
MAAKKTNPSVARARQFPAKAGEPETEVSERSADGSDGLRHIKKFVVGSAGWPTSGDDPAHAGNTAAVVNEAIQRGLHPRGDVSFDGEETHPNGVSTVLTYSVDTVPSSVDHSPEETTTPRDVVEADGGDTSGKDG